MTIMDSTVVNVALPTLRREFATSTTAVSAVVTSYLVAMAVVMPASGWLGDRVGGKRLLLGALALFTAASAACGLAGSLPALVAFRAVAGAAAGALIPVGMTMLYRTFPQAERIRATRLLMVPALLAPALCGYPRNVPDDVLNRLRRPGRRQRAARPARCRGLRRPRLPLSSTPDDL